MNWKQSFLPYIVIKNGKCKKEKESLKSRTDPECGYIHQTRKKGWVIRQRWQWISGIELLWGWTVALLILFSEIMSYLFLCNWHKKYSFSIRIVISEFLPKKSYFLPKTQTNLHYRNGIKKAGKSGVNNRIYQLFYSISKNMQK